MLYRSSAQFDALVKSAVKADAAEIRTLTDVLGNVAFVEIRRRTGKPAILLDLNTMNAGIDRRTDEPNTQDTIRWG